MIILKVHFANRVVLNPESNPPVAGHGNTVFAFPVTPERMKLPARHGRDLGEVIGKLQGGQDRPDLSDRVSGNAAHVVLFV